MTKAEIANVIRDFSLDVEAAMNDAENPIVKELRMFADRVEAEEGPDAPIEPVKPLPLGTYDYLHGEER